MDWGRGGRPTLRAMSASVRLSGQIEAETGRPDLASRWPDGGRRIPRPVTGKVLPSNQTYTPYRPTRAVRQPTGI